MSSKCDFIFIVIFIIIISICIYVYCITICRLQKNFANVERRFNKKKLKKMSENISLKMGVKFAASLNMGKNLCLVLYIMSYNQYQLYQNNQKMIDCELPLGMIYVSLI